MQFIPISNFDSFIKLPISDADFESARNFIHSNEKFSKYGIEEKEWCLHELKEEQKVLFYQWVAQLKSLEQLLVSGNLITKFDDKIGLIQNAFFPKFKAFITPYLFSVLRKNFEPKKAELLLSFAELLSDFESDEVQMYVKSQLMEKLAPLKEKIEKAKKDTEIHVLLEKEVTAETWKLINSFTNRFYAVKTSWIEYLIQLAHHPKSSKRLMLYCVEKMRFLDLKEQHKLQIDRLEKEIKSGVYQFEKNVMPWKRTVILSSILLLILSFSIGIFFYNPEPELPPRQEETSFMKLTQKERDKIASLIQKEKEMRRKKVEELGLDANTPFIGEELVLRKNWTNERFEKMYDAWSQNDSVVMTGLISKSKQYKKPFSTTNDLRKKKNGKSTFFRNETPHSVLIIVFLDERNEKVYSTYVAANENAQINLATNEIMLVLPGNSINENASETEMPFNEIDHKFYDNLSLAYQMKPNPPNEVKFIWENLGGTEYYLVDLYNVLNKM
ncbi:MAG: hypothetical protein ACK46Y_02730 [Fluviicola sp.]